MDSREKKKMLDALNMLTLKKNKHKAKRLARNEIHRFPKIS